MAVKIKLTRLGKIRNPQYRVIVADARTRRDGRAIEAIGLYRPKEEPSFIEIDSERVQYWLSVGAQPTEPVEQLLKVTGDWQKFKGVEGAEGTLKTPDVKPSKLDLFNKALEDAQGEPLPRRSRPSVRLKRPRRTKSRRRPRRRPPRQRSPPKVSPRTQRPLRPETDERHGRRRGRSPRAGHRV